MKTREEKEIMKDLVDEDSPNKGSGQKSDAKGRKKAKKLLTEEEEENWDEYNQEIIGCKTSFDVIALFSPFSKKRAIMNR